MALTSIWSSCGAKVISENEIGRQHNEIEADRKEHRWQHDFLQHAGRPDLGYMKVTKEINGNFRASGLR